MGILGTLRVADESETVRFAARLADRLQAGDAIALEGPLGSGKTACARAIVRGLLGPDTDVPSPTFTLVQTYDTARAELWHVDLYRLGGPAEVAELGLDEAFAHAITLVEWPDRLGDLLPPTALHLTFADGPTPDARVITLHGPDAWAARLRDVLP